MENLEEVIMTLLARTIEEEKAKENWTSETDIINEIGLDSIQIVRFMLSLEDYLGGSLNYDDMSFDVFSSIRSLAEYIGAMVDERNI